MGRESELLQLVRREDVGGIARLLHKWRTAKTKLMGAGRRMNLNAQDAEGLTALHQAALAGSVQVVALLLDNGAFADVKDHQGLRALHYASWRGHTEMTDVLLQRGSSVDEPDHQGETPLHLACQHGHLKVVERLLQRQADPCLQNCRRRTPLDLACEFGRHQVVAALLARRDRDDRTRDEEEGPDVDGGCGRPSGLHLAAMNGHADTVRLLLRHGADVNLNSSCGTCLHQAALHGRVEVVQILLESGADARERNCIGQTALDVAQTTPTCRGAKELFRMLKEAENAVEARALEDYHNPGDPQGLVLREGDHVTVLDRRENGRWRGLVLLDNRCSRSGYFPSAVVELIDRSVGGSQRSKSAQSKKVAPPIVPDMNRNTTNSAANPGGRQQLAGRQDDGNSPGRDASLSGGCSDVHGGGLLSHHRLLSPASSATSSSSCATPTSPPVAPYYAPPGGGGGVGGHMQLQQHQHLITASVQLLPGQQQQQQQPSPRPVGCVGLTAPAFGGSSQPSSPSLSTTTDDGVVIYAPGYQFDKYPPSSYQQQISLEDQGIDVQSPGRDSPGSSGSSSGSGCRHSITSLDSGRASSSAYDGRTGHSYVAGHNQHRLSGHSYESATSLRQSYHSSSSSLGSMDRLDDACVAYSAAQINVSKLLNDGVPEAEVLRRWLAEHRFEEYSHLFWQAGYDMPTISRMTPEDLTAIGITNPSHRKLLKVEIGKLNISDGLPDYIPNSMDEWLHLLRLENYFECLVQQGYTRVEDVLGIAWEDLEEVGIRKLGHQKKMMLAIKRVKDIQAGVKRFSTVPDGRSLLEVHCCVLPPPASPGGPYQAYVPAPQQPPPTSCCPTLPSPIAEHAAVDFHRDFHQVASEAVDYIPYGAYSRGSHIIYRPDIVAIQVRHPSGARSLENLEEGREPPAGPGARHRTFLQTEITWHAGNEPDPNGGPTACDEYGSATSGGSQPQSRAWRRGSFDDGDLTPTNENVIYEMEGGGTLPRPKVSIKPRPVAKIVAKTRGPPSTGGGESGSCSANEDDGAEQEPIKKSSPDLASSPNNNTNNNSSNNSRNELMMQGSCSAGRSLPGSPLNSILRGKKIPPPPPPKRSNSIKGERKGVGNLDSGAGGDYSNEQLFASCVKIMASKFGMVRKGEWGPPTPGTSASGNPNSAGANPSSDEEGGDRAPPSPAPASPVRHRRRDPVSVSSSSAQGTGASSRISTSPDASCSPPFHSKPADAAASPPGFDAASGSPSSVGGAAGDSANTLPFANENVGTIKQRVMKSHLPLSAAVETRGSPVLAAKSGGCPQGPKSAPDTPKRRSSLGSEKSNCLNHMLGEMDISSEDSLKKPYHEHDTGDVLHDIDNMLANLTEELDAMLTNELQSQ